MPFPLKYVDVTRKTQTTLESPSEKSFEDYWNVSYRESAGGDPKPSNRSLSDFWTGQTRASTFPGFLISDGNRTLFPFHTVFPLAKTCFWKPPGSSSYTSPSEVRNTVSWTLPKCSRSSTAVVCDWNQKLCRPQRAKTTC